MHTDRSSFHGCRAARHVAQQSNRIRYLIRLAIGVALSLSLKSGMGRADARPTSDSLRGESFYNRQ